LNGGYGPVRISGGTASWLFDMAACLSGFCFCFAAYYPGVLSPDSGAMLAEAQDLSFSDWYPTMMPLLWGAIYRIIPGSQGMLALVLAFYWGALFLLARAAARIDRLAAPIMVITGLLPFTINFAGTLWTDVLVATSWLLCAAVAFSANVRGQPPSVVRRVVIWTLFLIGGLARANTLFAAVPLGLYLLQSQKPLRPANRTLVALLLPAALWLASWTLTYPILNARKTHPIQSIITFDLAGISHFTAENYFPSQWSAEERAEVLSSCYTPQGWDVYASGRCKFVWKRLKDEGFWGSSQLWRAWLDAVMAQPLAYLRHRGAHFWHFTTTTEYVFHSGTSEEAQVRIEQNIGFKWLQAYVLHSHRLWMFHPIFWLTVACGCLVAARRCEPASRKFVTALSLSSLVYLATYFFVGVASDFRYAYWAVLASTACVGVLACEAVAALRRHRYRVGGVYFLTFIGSLTSGNLANSVFQSAPSIFSTLRM
jgi:hypothetical protein